MVCRGQGHAGITEKRRPALCPEKKTDGIVDVFEDLFARTRPAFHQDRVFHRARKLAISSLLALGKRTISGMLCAGAAQFVDWSAAYRLFERERIDRDALFTPAREEVISRLHSDKPLVVMMDDTLVRKRGKKVHGTGWKRDPLGPHFCTNFVWGQRYLQMSAALPDPTMDGRARGIPIDFIHAPSPVKPRKKAPEEAWREYRTLQGEMKVSSVAANCLRGLREKVSGRRIICSVDGGFTNQTVFRSIPDNTVLVGRIRKDSRLYAVPEDRGPRRGRRSFYGEQLPTPEEVRQDADVPWETVQAFASGKRHQFEVKTMPAVRWRGTGDRTVSVVVVRPLAYRPRKGARLLYRNPVYLLCTDPTLPLHEILQSYLWRWEIELNFKDEKSGMGVGEAQVRTKPAVESAPALVVAAYAYLLLAGTAGEGDAKPLPHPKWQRQDASQRCSSQQMRNLFRAGLWQIAIDVNKTHVVSHNQQKRSAVYFTNSLNDAVCYAFR